MRTQPLILAALAASLAAPVGAARDPEARCNLATISTPTLFDVPAYTLVMAPPKAEPAVVEAGPVEARKGLVVARQMVRLEPRRLFLPRSLDFQDEKGKSLSKAVPLHAGAPITQWRGPQGDIRHCSIGWQDGLFGPATNYGHYRWICFEDRDADGAFEVAFRPFSKDLGLSFRQLDMPIEPPVRFLDTAPTATPAGSRNLGALNDQEVGRGVAVTRIGGGLVRFELVGPGAPDDKDARRVELALDAPGAATLGGITVSLAPQGKGKAMLSTAGVLDPLEIAPACGGASWRLGNHVPMVNFTFPNW